MTWSGFFRAALNRVIYSGGRGGEDSRTYVRAYTLATKSNSIRSTLSTVTQLKTSSKVVDNFPS